MSWVDQLKDSLPEYAKDIKLNLDAVINRSTIDAEHATYLSIAAAFATGNAKLLTFIVASATDEVEKNAALTAGSIMAQNNVWYPFIEMADDPNLKGLPAQLRMNAISAHGGTTKAKFEAYETILFCIASVPIFNSTANEFAKASKLVLYPTILSKINIVSSEILDCRCSFRICGC